MHFHATYNLFFRSLVLEIPKETAEYNKIRDWIVNTPSVMAFERIRENPKDASSWVVWIGWTDVRGVIPTTPRVL